jgi:hypothetical protein
MGTSREMPASLKGVNWIASGWPKDQCQQSFSPAAAPFFKVAQKGIPAWTTIAPERRQTLCRYASIWQLVWNMHVFFHAWILAGDAASFQN